MDNFSFNAVRAVLLDAAERIEADAQDLMDCHAPDGDWAVDGLAEAEHDDGVRLVARHRLAAG